MASRNAKQLSRESGHRNGRKNGEIAFRSSNREAERLAHYLRHGEDNPILVGPTGCGKTTLVQDLASRMGQRLEVVVGAADLTVSDLLGRWHLDIQGSVWRDGPLTRAVREGALFYFDEIGSVPEDVLKILYPLLDHRRTLVVPGQPASYRAHAAFRFVASYNPSYGNAGRGFTPAFRQRCRFLPVSYLPPEQEKSLLQDLAGVTAGQADFLVQVGQVTRTRLQAVLPEGASTRLLLMAARSLADGFPRDEVVHESIVLPLVDDPGLQQTVLEALQSAGLFSIDEIRRLQLTGGETVELPMADDHFFETAEEGDPSLDNEKASDGQ